MITETGWPDDDADDEGGLLAVVCNDVPEPLDWGAVSTCKPEFAELASNLIGATELEKFGGNSNGKLTCSQSLCDIDSPLFKIGLMSSLTLIMPLLLVAAPLLLLPRPTALGGGGVDGQGLTHPLVVLMVVIASSLSSQLLMLVVLDDDVRRLALCVCVCVCMYSVVAPHQSFCRQNTDYGMGMGNHE